MVQVLTPKHHPSFSEKLGLNKIGENFGKGFTSGIENNIKRKELMRQEANKAAQMREQESAKLANAYKLKEYEYDRKKEIEELRGNRKNQEEADKLKSNREIVRALEKQYELPEGSLEAYVTNPNLAASVSKPPKETNKNISEKPIDPEQLKLIEDVRKNPEYEKASPNQKYQMLTSNGVSRANAKSESDIAAEEEKINVEKEKGKNKKTSEQNKQEFDEKIRIHKESEEYDKEILSKSRSAKRSVENIKEAEKALKSNKVKPGNTLNILRLFGEPGKALSNAIMNKETKSIQALMPEFLEGKKELFGVRLSDADLNLLQDKSIDIGNSIEANEAVLGLLKKYADASILRGDIASEISKKGGGYRPINYERAVDEEYDRQMTPVSMLDSKGKTYQIPAYRVGGAIKRGLRVKNE
jgi:hypothetical protein